MDRYVNQDAMAFQIGIVEVDVQFVAGASGAVPSALSGYIKADGITGMSLAATGLYTVTLQDSYVTLLPGYDFRVQQATYSAAAACRGELVAVSVADDSPTVQFQAIQNGTGAATAVTEGDTVHIHLRLQRQAQP